MSDIGHSILVCPSCAKSGKSRGALQSYYHHNETHCLYCAFCGWKGDYSTCQSYEFPCRIYKVVEIDIAVLENLLSIALQQPSRILPASEIAKDVAGGVMTLTISGEYTEDTLHCKQGYHDLKAALSYLTGAGWLFPAVYKVDTNV